MIRRTAAEKNQISRVMARRFADVIESAHRVLIADMPENERHEIVQFSLEAILFSFIMASNERNKEQYLQSMYDRVLKNIKKARKAEKGEGTPCVTVRIENGIDIDARD
jgi:hypothetical protein